MNCTPFFGQSFMLHRSTNSNKLIRDATFTKKGTDIFGTSSGPKARTEILEIRPGNIQDLINALNE